MPQGRDGSRKRLRMETGQERPSNVIKPTADDTPKWIDTMNKKTTQTIANITKSVCKKKAAIKKLEEHVAKQTCPPSLRVNVRVMVSEPQQEKMDAILKTASEEFQDKVLRQLMEARKEELKILINDRNEALEEWKLKFSTTVNQMDAECLLTEDKNVYLKRHCDKFDLSLKECIRKIQTSFFLQQKEEMDRRAEVREAEAEKEMDETLQDANMKTIMEKLNKLERQVAGSKKGQGKSTKPAAKVGGANKQRNAQSSKKPKPKTPKKIGNERPNPNAKTQAKGKGKSHAPAKGKGVAKTQSKGPTNQ